MSAMVKYTIRLEEESPEEIDGIIDGIAANINAAAVIAEVIADSSNPDAETIAHGVAELLHMNNHLLSNLALRVRREKRSNAGGSA